MKVTALIPNQLIEEVKSLSEGKNITDALVIALSEWTAHKKIRALNQSIKLSPIQFKKGYNAQKIRKTNRK